jgi:exopolysaccharide biosynthesis polyprenyl glycosylphosphotransferase
LTVTVDRIPDAPWAVDDVADRLPEQAPPPGAEVTLIDLRDGRDLSVEVGPAGVVDEAPARAAHPMRAYARRALVGDSLAIAIATSTAVIGRFIVGAPRSSTSWEYAAIGFVIGLAWLCTLAFSGAYEQRVLGVGADEFKRVIVGTAALFGLVGTVSYILKAEVSRGFVLIALPLGLIALLLGRILARRWLNHRRATGSLLSRTLLIGYPHQTAAMSEVFAADPGAGFQATLMHRPPAGDLDSWLNLIDSMIAGDRIDAIAIMQSDQITDEVIRLLSWRVEGRGIDLLVAPTLGDHAGPRLTFRPAAGLPLIHLDEPQLTGSKQVTKRALDILASACLLVVLCPLMLGIAATVRVSSRGPVIFRQKRVGRDGQQFTMLKFRTMIDGADRLHSAAIAEALAAGSQTTLPTDNRITRAGQFLRRWSLDELPQLFNVLRGTMSLVGPRPLLLSEADDLPQHIQRRHLTKPGLTGLWQISGRKGTTWDERMRLDLYYVENWSPALDLVILLKTAKAVVSGAGAY